MKGRRFSVMTLCLTLVGGMLVGCQDSKKENLNEYVARIKARPPGPVGSVPIFQPQPQFAYPMGERRDPFSPLVKKNLKIGAIRPDPNRAKEPLESFSLDALRMVGILHKGNTIWAIISTPKGTVERITVGSHLGRQYGKVIKITPTTIEIVEIVRRGDGWVKRNASLSIIEED